MSSKDIYPYASGDLLKERNTYFYSQYHGEPFLDAWAAQRTAIFENSPFRKDLHESHTPTLDLIKHIHDGLTAEPKDQSAWRNMDRLVQRFEVTKRVHDAYSNTWRAVDPLQFYSSNAYVKMAEAVGTAHQISGDLTFLNVLLKIMDTLTSLAGGLSFSLQSRLKELVILEAKFVYALRDRASARVPASCEPLPSISFNDAAMPASVLLAADSARSRAYVQAMCHYGMDPARVYIMGSEKERVPTDGVQEGTWQGLFLPELAERISETCDNAGVTVTRLSERDVNSDSTITALSALSEDLVVYSGVGGQIVSECALRAGPRFLHMHSGWLPDYRGSTTLYYAILNGDLPGVTSILLDSGIDTGPVVLRKQYLIPDPLMDVDLTYDAAIRADLLCRTLAHFSKVGHVKPQFSQSTEMGRSYYVIHPVLKHIALLSLGKT